MGQRLDLHADLISILGSNNVYYQPPATIKMQYPCVVYSLSDINSEYADNRSYSNRKRYMLTVIDANPDTDIPDRLLERLPYCNFDRRYTSENLHHSVLTLYY